jgi:glucose/arabinose dehydrogenase
MRICPNAIRAPAITAIGLSALLVLAACGAPQPPPSETATASTATSGNAEVRLGAITARASAIQTSLLAEAVAHQYGVARDPKSVLLLVALDTSTAAGTASPPATVRATVTDLRGSRTDIAMHAVQADGSIDWIGVTDTSLPDTLRFDVTVSTGPDATARMQIQREFYPR